MLNIPRYASQITPCLPQSGTSSPAQAVFKHALERVEENYKLKGCHVKILSLLIIGGSIADQPAICKGYKV